MASQNQTPGDDDLVIEARDRETGDAVDLGVLEAAGVAFDPTQQHLDLTKEEKRRTTALMLGIQACRDLIIKDADYLREAARLAQTDQGPALRPATIDAVVIAAIKFDTFIATGRGLPGALPEASK